MYVCMYVCVYVCVLNCVTRYFTSSKHATFDSFDKPLNFAPPPHTHIQS